jgi:DNA-directed RNA polymerase alpha subunit
MGILDQIEQEREKRHQRDLKIVAAWESGQSYAEIGLVLQLSKGNVKNRIERYFQETRRQESIDPFDKLRSRTLKILQQEGLTTVGMVVEKYRRNELITILNFGYKSLREIETLFPVKSD